MKKLVITIAILLGLNAITFAQDGLFQRGIIMNDDQWVYFRNGTPIPRRSGCRCPAWKWCPCPCWPWCGICNCKKKEKRLK